MLIFENPSPDGPDPHSHELLVGAASPRVDAVQPDPGRPPYRDTPLAQRHRDAATAQRLARGTGRSARDGDDDDPLPFG